MKSRLSRGRRSDRRTTNLKEAAHRLATQAGPLTAREVAELCGVEVKTVHNWVAQRLLGHFRTPGRHLRFQASEVLLFLESCGYVAPTESAQPTLRVLLLIPQPRKAKLRAALAGCELIWAKELESALVIAGRERPAFICLHAEAIRSLDPAAVVRALCTELLQARVIWMGPPPGLKVARLTVVARDGYDAVALLASRL